MHGWTRHFVCFVVIASGFLCATHAQQVPQRAAGTVTERVRAVLVDVVVRDKRGMPVSDLTETDFEILEDNLPQQIGSFTRISDGVSRASEPSVTTDARAAAAPSAAAVGSSVPVSELPPVTALVFDRLNPEARRLAVQAAQNYFGSKEETPGYVGIFSIDLGLTPYAPFTRNSRVLQQALTKLASRASASFNNREQREQRSSADQQAATANQAVSGVASTGGPGASAAMGTAPATALIAEMQSKMIRDFEVMEHDQQGYSTTNGLFAIINAMRDLPGRKSLVLFSEGISIPPAVQRLFLSVIDAANRANVSIYAMDAAGLRAESEQAKIRDQVNQAAKTGIDTGYSNTNTRNTAPLTKGLENNEDVLRQDPHTGLGQLSQDTGGQLFENTNNLRQGFDRIESDLRNYYLIGYTPNNENYDGRFRTIDVRVRRPGLTVAARRGYFAVRDAGGSPINEWEAPALAALEQKPVPNAFQIRAGALLFPERDRPGLTPVVVSLNTAPLTFRPGDDGKTYTSDFEVIVRFLDGQNRVARKLSQHYEIKGPLAEIDRAKQGDVIFYREPELPSGVYSMETVVYDAPSGKASVRYSTVEVPRADPAKLTMSTLVIVKGSEKLAEKDRRADNPLLVNDVVLYPNLGESVSKASKEVGFYFSVYPASQDNALESRLELLQNGKPVAQVPMPLRARDARGRIQAVGRLPLESLAPGTYELRAIVRQGSDQIFRSAMLHIVE
jgi:VWFA-related protein